MWVQSDDGLTIIKAERFAMVKTLDTWEIWAKTSGNDSSPVVTRKMSFVEALEVMRIIGDAIIKGHVFLDLHKE